MCNTKSKDLLKTGILLVFLALPAILWGEEGDTWIVFECNRPNPNTTENTYWDIWRLDPDGNGQPDQYDGLYGDPLTKDPANEWDPTYSKEDESVVFVSDKDGWPHLYKISIDATPATYWKNFTPPGFENCATVDPCYNFQGTKIAFTSNKDEHWHIYTMNTDMGDIQPITLGSSDNRSPCFSSDGNKIYFISNRDANEIGDWEIYVADLTQKPISIKKAIVKSNGVTPYFLDYTEHDPCCSPTDPNIIVFATNVATPTYTDPGIINEANRINFELFSYNFVTKDTNRLTESWCEYQGSKGPVAQLWNSSMSCFSPDGQRIAWAPDNWSGGGSFDEEGEGHGWKWGFGSGNGSCHNIWIRNTSDAADEYQLWKSPTLWRYRNGPTRYTESGYPYHDKHYNPSWDWQEPQE